SYGEASTPKSRNDDFTGPKTSKPLKKAMAGTKRQTKSAAMPTSGRRGGAQGTTEGESTKQETTDRSDAQRVGGEAVGDVEMMKKSSGG
ncbi:hypothetical protein PMAYCL1PPCAC_31086, partial [Pristionchus mayeri]